MVGEPWRGPRTDNLYLCVGLGDSLPMLRLRAPSRSFLLLLAWVGLGCEAPPKAESAPATSVAESPAAVSPTAPPSPEPAEPAAPPIEKKAVTCPGGSTPFFADPALEKEVRRKAGKEEGALTLADVRKVRSVDLTRAGVEHESLDPCAFPLLTGLRHLYVGRGSITDLTPIKGLTKLEGLRISMNPVSDISPLAGMLQMDRLDLGRTLVRDLGPLKKMTKLTELMLDDTPVDDLGPLAGLSSLERLSIKRTRVSDLSPLKSLRKLKFLYVGGSPVESAGGIARPGLKISADD